MSNSMRCTIVVLCLVVGFLGAPEVALSQPADCPAPMYGLNPANTGQSTLLGLSKGPRLAWEVQVLGDSSYPRSLALSSSGILYTPGDDLYALRATNGQVVWRQPQGSRDSRVALDAQGREFAFESGRLQARKADTGAHLWTGAPSFVSDGEPVKIGSDGTVFAPEIRGVIYAYTPGGTLKWQSSSYGLIQYGETAIIPAIDQQGNIYFGGGNKLVSLDASGQVRWSLQHSSMSASRVMLSSSGNVVWQRNGEVEIRSSADGQILNHFHSDGALQAIDSEDNLYFSSNYWIDKTTYAGLELWKFQKNYMDWPLTVDAAGKVYCATQQGDILALSATGQQLWNLHVTDAYPVLYSCAPVIGEDGSVYVLTRDGVAAIVPEPATISLLALGGLAMIRRRRR